MSFHTLSESDPPGTPGAGLVSLYADKTANPRFRQKDDAGIDSLLGGIYNASTVAQVVVAATRTYIAGSALAIPVAKLKVGSRLRWTFSMTKTGAGIAASTIAICFGTLGTTGDTDRVSFAKPAGTAAIDEAYVTVEAVVRSIGAAGVVVGQFVLVHNLAATGHAVIPCVVVNSIGAGFDLTVAALIAGLTITTGAADAITIQIVTAELVNV